MVENEAAESSNSNSNSNSNNNNSNSSSNKSFGKKCSNVVKKQKTKFYILRRCVAILLCWHEPRDNAQEG
ncbi:small polypeptide DEVIL 16-like [Spinacia oleracea]|uniref:Small polypeptide DEVIL 16-like n=1 Tax=Spinacia oleracea TaxID=3562 RepID=A0A9R0J8N9_SPIOL|nr:small polypeptide DEVIL 16-like [Spinacia oleracea]